MKKLAKIQFRTIILDASPPDDRRINQLIHWGKRFHQLGLAPESAGNLSFRTRKGFIITGTGVKLGAIEKENVAEVLKIVKKRNQFWVYAKGWVVPSKESLLHREVYDSRSEIRAVFHIHDELTVRMAERLKLAITKKEQPRGSPKLAKEVGKFLGSKKDIRYLVLKNHGVLALGTTIKEAGELIEFNNKRGKTLAQALTGFS